MRFGTQIQLKLLVCIWKKRCDCDVTAAVRGSGYTQRNCDCSLTQRERLFLTFSRCCPRSVPFTRSI